MKILKTAFKLALSVIILTALFSFFTPGQAYANPGWYNSGWLYRKSITINHLNVTANLTNFPVMINLTSDAGLAAHAQVSGNDILFTSGDEVTKLPHEIEKFVKATGQLVAWVNVPAVSTTTDTVIYIYYGNAGAANQQNATGVWDSNFKMVQHLEEASGGSNAVGDSTSYANNGTDYNSPTFGAAGKIDGAVSFNRTTNQNIQLPASNAILNADNFTLEAWFNTTLNHPAYGNEGRIVNLHRGAVAGSAVSLYVTQNSTSGQGQIALFYYEGTTSHYLTYTTNYSNSVSHHIAATHSTSDNTYRLYYDGIQVATEVNNFIGFGTENAFIATHDGTQRSFTGTVDEVRLSKTVRSADWVRTSFNNQNSPSTFYTLGNEIGAATVATNAASNIAGTTATVNGTLTFDGGEACQYRFEYGTTYGGPYGFNTGWTGSINTGAQFSAGLTGLTKGQTYYFRANASNNYGVVYGSEQSFMTRPDAPTGFTATPGDQQISLLWTNGAGSTNTTIRGNIGSYPTDYTDGTLVYNGTGTSTIHTGLTNGNHWYYRAWSVAINGTLTQYSSSYIQADATPAPSVVIPTVTTDNASSEQETTATLNGVLTSDGGAACQYAFEWGTASGIYTDNISWTGSITTGQTFNTGLTGLTKGQPYYYRAMVKNTAGVAYGSEIHFLTKPDPPSNFVSTVNGTTALDFTWTKGTGALRTMVRRSTAGYPASYASGDQVYFDVGTGFTDTGLTNGTVYYYAAWSEVTGSQQWSNSSATVQMTAGGGSSVTAIGGIVFPINKVMLMQPYIINIIGGILLLSLVTWVLRARR